MWVPFIWYVLRERCNCLTALSTASIVTGTIFRITHGAGLSSKAAGPGVATAEEALAAGKTQDIAANIPAAKAAAPAEAAPAEATAEKPDPNRSGKLVRNAGAQLHYQTFGDRAKPCIVFIHGVEGNCLSFF